MKRFEMLVLTVLFLTVMSVGSAAGWSVDASYVVIQVNGRHVHWPDVIRQSPSFIEGWYGVEDDCINNLPSTCGDHNSLTHYPDNAKVCPGNFPAWNSEEFTVPSVISSSIAIFENPGSGSYYKYIASMLGQQVNEAGCRVLPYHATFGMVGILLSNDGKNWIEPTTAGYHFPYNPILTDDNITNMIHSWNIWDFWTHSIEMFDMIYEDGHFTAVVFAPPTDLNLGFGGAETWTWVLTSTNGLNWSISGKVSGYGITVNPQQGYPEPWLVNVRIAYDDYYYYMSRHDAYNYPNNHSDLPDKGEIYRMPKSQFPNGTWQKLVEYGCNTAFPLVGNTMANEGSSFESDGSGRLLHYTFSDGKQGFIVYTAGNTCAGTDNQRVVEVNIAQ